LAQENHIFESQKMWGWLVEQTGPPKKLSHPVNAKVRNIIQACEKIEMRKKRGKYWKEYWKRNQ